MDARQRVKLSLTNRSIGLIHCAPQGPKGPKAQRVPRAAASLSAALPSFRRPHLQSCPLGPGDLVVMARFQTPDPIPNSAVKHLSANGTAS